MERAISENIVIHALPVGGGILALSPLPGAGGDYKGDLMHIASWKPAFVVSLVTNVELFEAGATSLGQDIVEHGTRWVHMPIRDFGAPNSNFEDAWPDTSERARRALLGGGRVLLHCRGGCGRSGMVALRLMIEAGEAPDEALERLRSVRPCAIETDEQMEWAMKAERLPALFVRHND
ncbi:protein-tyrosine phosphatase family protein [Primorskyibacter sp. 2E233]|uniref:protein-tyrosine phosphatase family protein n=1 Tax=Primorskyibacter sp. 2E233 TaxID=3413431 RepID=UPI003BF17A44